MNRPSDKRSFGLSPQKQALLDMMLRQAGLDQEAARGIPRRQDKGPAPTSFAQQRLWFLDQLAPNNSFYNLSTAVRFQVSLNLIALERAINEIVRRHEALRTTFPATDGQPRQEIAPSAQVLRPTIAAPRSVVRSRPICHPPHQPLVVLVDSHHRGHQPLPLRGRDDDRLGAHHDRPDGIGGAEVDSDDFGHDISVYGRSGAAPQRRINYWLKCLPARNSGI